MIDPASKSITLSLEECVDQRIWPAGTVVKNEDYDPGAPVTEHANAPYYEASRLISEYFHTGDMYPLDHAMKRIEECPSPILFSQWFLGEPVAFRGQDGEALVFDGADLHSIPGISSDQDDSLGLEEVDSRLQGTAPRF